MKRILPAMLFFAVFAVPITFAQRPVKSDKNYQVFTKGTTQVKVTLTENGSLIGVTTLVFRYRSGELVRYDRIQLSPLNGGKISGPAIKALVRAILAAPFEAPGSLLVILHATGIIQKSADGKTVVKITVMDGFGKVRYTDTYGPEMIPEFVGPEPPPHALVRAWPVWEVPAIPQPEEFSGDGI